MKILATVFALVIFPVFAGAHGIQSVKDNLARPDSVYGARVNVAEKGSAQVLVRNLDMPNPGKTEKGYRVCIFSEKNQNARQKAFAAEAQFKQHFPDVATYVIYDKSSTWKVMTGNCLTFDEVTILQGKAEKVFPGKPYIVNEDIPISEFGKKGSSIASSEYLARRNASAAESNEVAAAAQ